MFDGMGKNALNNEYFDVFRKNILRIVAKIAHSDFQLSLPFGPAESELDLDFYQFSITLVEKNNKFCVSLPVENLNNKLNAKIYIACSFLPIFLYNVKMNTIRRLFRKMSPDTTGRPDLFTTKICSHEEKS